jgi:hypothetical protein
VSANHPKRNKTIKSEINAHVCGAGVRGVLAVEDDANGDRPSIGASSTRHSI